MYLIKKHVDEESKPSNFFFLACPQTSNILQPMLDAFLGILIVDCKVVCCAHLLQDRTLE